MNIKNIKLVYNNTEKCKEIVDELYKKLVENNFQIVKNDYQLVIAIGGDGAFLRMVKECMFDTKIYYIGINAGTLGFSQEIYPNEIDKFINNLKNFKYKIEEIGIINSYVYRDNEIIKKSILNEIVVRDQKLGTAYFDIVVDNMLLETFVGDGILIATSFGSTAYNLNYGGSIVYNSLHTMQITPIAPINSKVSTVLRNSVLLPEDKNVEIIPKYRTKDIIMSIDGENYSTEDVLKIDLKVENKIKILRMNNYDYTKRINEKLLK